MRILKALCGVLGLVASVAFAQVPISGLPPAVTPLTGSEIMILNQNSFTRQTPISSLTSIVPPITAPFVLQSASPTLTNSRVLRGTTNQVIITDGGPLGNLTLSLPQSIANTSIPNFAGLTLTGLLTGTTANFSGNVTAGSFTGTFTAPGLNTQVMFNDGGVIAGNSLMTFTKGTVVLNLGAATTPGTFSVGSLDAMVVNGVAVPIPGFALNSNIQGVFENHSYVNGVTAGGARYYGVRSEGTISSPAIVVNGDHLSTFYAAGYNGTNYSLGGSIQFAVEGTPGATAMPSSLDLAVSPSGSQIPTSRLTLHADGSFGVSGSVGSTGAFLRSAGAGNPAAWSTVLIPNAATLGDLWYGSASNVVSTLAGNTTSTKQFLTQTGTGVVSAAPVWGTIAAGDLPGGFSGFANPSANVGLLAVNGVATTAMRSDAAPALSQSISPTWTGTHVFSGSSPLTILNAATAAADTKNWDTRLSSAGNWALSTATDLSPSTPVKDAMAVSRTTTAISSITLGNTTDNPVTTLHGGAIFDSARPTVSSGTSSIVLGASSGGIAQAWWVDSAGAADSKMWDINSDTTSINLRAVNDANNSASTWLRAVRSGVNISSVSVGGPFVSAGATTGTTCPVTGGGTTGTNCFSANATAHAAWSAVVGPLGGAGNELGLFITGGNSSNSTDTLFRVDSATSSSLLNIDGSNVIISNAGTWKFSGVSTTASAANAFLDNANGNNLLRSTSSRRYKTDISTMSGVASNIIYQLRPVRFHSLASADDHHSWFYGLVAEEVAAVEPSLVVKDPSGKPDGVQYDRLQVFMLPEVQKLRRDVDNLQLQVRLLYGLVVAGLIYVVYANRKGGSSV